MTPPQVHIHLAVSGNAGNLLMFTLIAPGAQGAGITGIQGIGVKTPNAAAVAAATVGFAMEEHIPKGSILTMGT